MAADSMPVAQGFVNLDKPVGLPSRRATELVSRCFGRAPAGHAGTLDPLASGVLPVALGAATRLVELLLDAEKEYRAVVRLGADTDTDDAAGRPLGPARPVAASAADVERALAGFRGRVSQRPPRYSALKLSGRPAYALARAGRPAEPAARQVEFRELRLLGYAPPDAELFARVSRGTYLRSLARDLGAALGCGGHLAALVRTRVGGFRAEEAVGLDRLRELAAAGRAAEVLLTPASALPDLPLLTARDEPTRRRVREGRRVPLAEFTAAGAQAAAGGRCLVLDARGRLVALGEVVAAGAEDGPSALAVQPRRRLEQDGPCSRPRGG